MNSIVQHNSPDPSGIPGDKDLREGNYLGAVLSCFCDVFACFGDGALQVKPFWFELGDCNSDEVVLCGLVGSHFFFSELFCLL